MSDADFYLKGPKENAVCRIKEDEAIIRNLHNRIEELEVERDALQADNERLRRDRREALNVTSREGLLASEWVARTGRAEAERDALQARVDELEQRRVSTNKITHRVLLFRKVVDTLEQVTAERDALQARVAAVEALPDKWRGGSGNKRAWACANELEATLKGNENDV